MWWQHLVYPLGLLISLGCLAYVDYTYHIAFWRNPKRAALIMALAMGYFIIWDICGIRLDIFYAADSTYRSGILLGPSFPIEEVLFLALLIYTTLLSWAFWSRSR